MEKRKVATLARGGREEVLEGALRSALLTMSLAAGILEKDGDEFGVARNLRNGIEQGNRVIQADTLFGLGIVIDPTLPEGMAEIKDGEMLLARIVGLTCSR